MNKTPFQIALEVKEHLIQLAADDKLPMDLNQLDVTPIEKIVGKAFPTQEEKSIQNAHYYLLGNEEMSIEQQVEAIANHENEFDYIDYVEGVVVWEPLENKLTCSEFLELIDC